MQMKTTMRYYLTLVRMVIISKSMKTISAGESMEKGEHSYIVGGTVNLYNHFLSYRSSLKKQKQSYHMI